MGSERTWRLGEPAEKPYRIRDPMTSPTVPGGPHEDGTALAVTTVEGSWHLVLAFGAVALVAAGHALHDGLEGTPWDDTLPPFLVMVLCMVALTLGHRWLAQRNAGRVATVVAHLSVSALFGALWLLSHDSARGVIHAFAHGAPAGVAMGGFWSLVFRLPAAVRENNRRRLAAESACRRAELAQLRSSLQPHFLLNTLHAIAALTVDEPHVARQLLAALGDLLRDTIEPAPEVRPLQADVAWLYRYADILTVRHRGSLRFEWDVAPATTGVPLPKLLLQPLLENAVKHGALRCAEKGGAEEDSCDEGVVAIRTRLTGSVLELVIEDNGPGIAPGGKEGLGLRIVRERLRLARPGATLRLESSHRGTRATIEIPWTEEARP